MYREIAPPTGIAAHVASVWTRGPEPAERSHRIVPDACADIVWITGRRLLVAGPSTGPVVSTIPRGGSAVGVRFRVGAAGSALGVPARELLDGYADLEAVWGDAGAELADRLAAAPTLDAAVAVLAAAVERRLPPPGGDRPGRARRRARRRRGRGRRSRRSAPGWGSASGNCAGASTTPSATGRRRSSACCASSASSRWPTAERTAAAADPDLARLAFAAGYADQAHLTRECTPPRRPAAGRAARDRRRPGRRALAEFAPVAAASGFAA